MQRIPGVFFVFLLGCNKHRSMFWGVGFGELGRGLLTVDALSDARIAHATKRTFLRHGAHERGFFDECAVFVRPVPSGTSGVWEGGPRCAESRHATRVR